jgi:hypothetical protein
VSGFTQRGSFGQRVGTIWFWLRNAWPQVVLGLALSIFFYLLVVPDQPGLSENEVASAREHQTKLLLVLVAVMVLAGWRICFWGRNYLTARYIRYLVQSIFLSPVLFGLAVFALLAYVPQMREVYLVLIDERRYFQGLAGLGGILFLCILIGCWQRSVGEHLLGGLYPDHADLSFDRGLGRVLAFKGNLASMLPLIGLVAGLLLLLTQAETQVARLNSVDEQLGRQTVGDLSKVVRQMEALVFALPFVAIPAAMLLWLVMFGMRKVVTAGPKVSRTIMQAGGAVAAVCIAAPLLLGDRTVEVARALGPLAVVAVALISFAAFFNFLSWLSVRVRVPVTGLFVVVLAGVLLLPLLSSGGPAKPTRAPGPQAGQAEELHRTFLAWLESRPDKELYIASRKPYPVFIVAASGGGIYAASSAATFLAEVQDECASFARHVFVISGVSGGAVGASLFNALTNADTARADRCVRNPAQSLTDHTEQIVRSDHLSPVVALLVSDLARKLGNALAGTVESTRTDRADMLQRSFSTAFIATASCKGPVRLETCAPLATGKGLDIGFSEHWSATSRAPGLILNTTWSETGYRVAFAPYPLHAISDGTMFNFAEIATANTIGRTLIEAAVVSARFPGIVPAWPVINPRPGEKQRWNFVDGGYVDNSGATSALEIYTQLAQYLPPAANASSLYQRKYPPLGMEIDLRLILLTDAEPEPELELGKIQGSGYSDTIAPLKALLQVRSQLSSRAITQTINRVEPGIQRRQLTAREGDSRVWLVNLEQTVFPLPLGWMISRVSNDIVSYMLGRPDLCQDELIRKQASDRRVQRAVETVVENSCVKKRIIDLVRSGETP